MVIVIVCLLFQSFLPFCQRLLQTEKNNGSSLSTHTHTVQFFCAEDACERPFFSSRQFSSVWSLARRARCKRRQTKLVHQCKLCLPFWLVGWLCVCKVCIAFVVAWCNKRRRVWRYFCTRCKLFCFVLFLDPLNRRERPLLIIKNVLL